MRNFRFPLYISLLWSVSYVAIANAVVYEFDEKCCTDEGVPEECMGFCRAETGRDAPDLFPVNRCEKYRETIKSCMKLIACTKANNPCQNNAPCTDTNTDGQAECDCSGLVAFEGDHCDVVTACKTNPCNNGGTCADKDLNGIAECTCKGGFSGDTCDTPPSNCVTSASSKDPNTPCRFPFTAYGKANNGCILSGSYFWCATVDEYQTGTENKWGYCSKDCPMAKILKFLRLSMSSGIPVGYRLATVEDVNENNSKARAAVGNGQWLILKLKNGKIAGRGYNYEVKRGNFPNLGHKLVITVSCTDGVKNQDETGIDCGGLNCPVCGSTTSRANQEVTTDAPRTRADCVDTANWEDGEGVDCAEYEELYCENGTARPGYDSLMTSARKDPQDNCCACGKE